MFGTVRENLEEIFGQLKTVPKRMVKFGRVWENLEEMGAFRSVWENVRVQVRMSSSSL